MALVIAHAELVSDQTSDPRTAPQRRREAVRLGAFQQQRLEAFELRGVQQRLTAGAAGLAQPGFAVTPVSSQPLADALPRDLQSPRCLGLTTALLDQPDRFETALLQGLEIPPYAFLYFPYVQRRTYPKKVSLYFARLNSDWTESTSSFKNCCMVHFSTTTRVRRSTPAVRGPYFSSLCAPSNQSTENEAKKQAQRSRCRRSRGSGGPGIRPLPQFRRSVALLSDQQATGVTTSAGIPRPHARARG